MPHPEDLMVLGGWAFLVGATTTLAIGLFVVFRYPHEQDPKRNRKRYVIPSALGLLVAVVGLVVMVGNALVVVSRIVT